MNSKKLKINSSKIDKLNNPQQLEVDLQIVFLKEDRFVIAYSPALDLSAYGDNVKGAQKAFEKSFLIFLEEMTERGTLLNELLRLGWELKQTKFKPPVLNKKNLHKRLASSNILSEGKNPEIIRTATKEVFIPA